MTRDTLTREQIVKAAIELLDDEGLDGFSMRTLGKRLGSAATAVYWHVGSKDNLVALASDRVWEEITLPDLAGTDWRTATTRMATDLHATLIRHSWLVQVFGSLMTYGPGKARFDDHTLAIYETAGFTDARADRAAGAVLTYVLGNALGQAAEVSLTRKLGPNGDARLSDSMAKAREVAAEFPRLRARLDSIAAAEYGSAAENSFEFGLEALLDGLENRR
jgi:AcrR family transcriptional regulator